MSTNKQTPKKKSQSPSKKVAPKAHSGAPAKKVAAATSPKVKQKPGPKKGSTRKAKPEMTDTAKKAVAKSSKTFATDFRFDEDVQLIKFISSDPLSFMQHWVNRPGKKSFISTGENDPLIAVGSKPDQKFAFTVLNLSDEDPQLQLMVVGVRLCGQLEKLASDKKTGPLNRSDLYWAVSKSGTGTKTSYSIMPVKERDLLEDWEIDPVAVSAATKEMKPLGPEALHTSTNAELAEIAREIAAAN
jgi:hypothetical protein